MSTTGVFNPVVRYGVQLSRYSRWMTAGRQPIAVAIDPAATELVQQSQSASS